MVILWEYLVSVLLFALLFACSDGRVTEPGVTKGVSPATRSALTELAGCDVFGARLTSCRASLDAAPLPTGTGHVRFSSFNLREQCVSFPERRPAISACAAASDCAAFSSCVSREADAGWHEADVQEVCLTYVARRFGPASALFEGRLEAKGPELRSEWGVRAFELETRCRLDDSVRAQMRRCVTQPDAEFVDCVFAMIEHQ